MKRNSDKMMARLAAGSGPRCNAHGDMPDGRHVTELENADLNIAELRFKQDAIREEGGDEGAVRKIETEIERRRTPAPAREPRFHPRYMNITAITTEARPVSTQVWIETEADLHEADRVLTKWCSPLDEKWHGRIVLASVFDTFTKVQRNFIRDGAVLRGIKA
jgi:hypothetical protein